MRYHQSLLAQTTQVVHQLKQARVLALELGKQMRLPLTSIGLLLRPVIPTHGYRPSTLAISTMLLRPIVTTSELFGESPYNKTGKHYVYSNHKH
jgi:hypothetical protein